MPNRRLNFTSLHSLISTTRMFQYNLSYYLRSKITVQSYEYVLIVYGMKLSPKRSVLALIEGRRLFRRLHFVEIRFDGLFNLLKYFRQWDSFLFLRDTIPVDSMFSEYDTFLHIIRGVRFWTASTCLRKYSGMQEQAYSKTGRI